MANLMESLQNYKQPICWRCLQKQQFEMCTNRIDAAFTTY